MLSFGLDYREKRAARRPYRRLIGRMLDNERVEGARFFADFSQRFGALENLILVVAIERDQDICAAFVAVDHRGNDFVPCVFGRRIHNVALHELNRLRIQARELDFRHGGNGGLNIAEREDEAHVFFGVGDKLHGELGDNAKRALRANHQVQQAIARACFRDLAAQAQHLAARQNHRHGKHIVARGAVLHGSHAAGVRGHVSADGSRFFAWIRRVHEAVVDCIGRQITQAHTRLHAHEQVVLVIFENLVHAHGAQHNAARQRRAATHQARSRSTHRYGDIVRARKLHNGRHFIGVCRKNHNVGHVRAVNRHLVVRIVFVDVPARKAIVLADDSGELSDKLVREFVIFDHGFLSMCLQRTATHGRNQPQRNQHRIKFHCVRRTLAH